MTDLTKLVVPTAYGDTLNPTEKKLTYTEQISPSEAADREIDRQADKLGFVDKVYKEFVSGGNYAVQVINGVNRRVEAGPDDPNWDSEAWLLQNQSIPRDQRYKFNLTNNQKEAEMLLADMVKNQETQDLLSRKYGVSSFVAAGLAGIIDVDTPLSLMSGGLSFAGARGIAASKIGRTALAAGAGGVAASGAAFAASTENAAMESAEIAIAALAGSAFGSVGAGISSFEHRGNIARIKTLDKLGDSLNYPPRNLDGDTVQFPDFVPARTAVVDDIEVEVSVDAPDLRYDNVRGWVRADADTDAGSVGARQVGGAAITQPISNATSRHIVLQAQQFANQHNLEVTWSSKAASPAYKGTMAPAKEAAFKAANKFQDMVQRSYFASDFSRLFNSPSVAAKVMAYNLMSNADGVFNNVKNAANIMDTQTKQMLHRFQPYRHAQDEYLAIAKTQKLDKTPHDFEVEVYLELNSRRIDGVRSAPPDSPIAKAADGVDEFFGYEVDLLGGTGSGKPAIDGAQNLQKQSGYVPQRVGSRGINRVHRGQGRSIKDIEDAYAEAMRSVHKFMTPDDAKIYAKAVIDRARNTGQGISSNLRGLFNQDGRNALEQMLQRQGNIPQATIDRILEGLSKNMAEKASPGFTKGRIDIDARFVASNGIRMIDLFDTNISDMVERRARSSSGRAGLVRSLGIKGRADWDAWVQAIMDEQAARPAKGLSLPTSVSDVGRAANDFLESEAPLTKDYFDRMWEFYAEGTVTPMNPAVSAILKVTTLGLLNQRALTDAAELGPIIQGMGFNRFLNQLPDALKKDIYNTGSPLLDELAHVGVFVPEDRMFMHMGAELDQFDPHKSIIMQHMNNLLNKGLRFQDKITLARTVRDISQRFAQTTAWDRVMRTVRDGDGLSLSRLRSMGFSDYHLQEFKKRIDAGIVEFDEKGYLKKLNLNKWGDENLVDDALYQSNHITNQYVQKAMAGESNILFHRDGLSALLLQFKSFPLIAMEKQLMRNVRIADADSWGQLWYGMAAAGMAYTARQVINGRTENLTPTKVAQGAFNISSMSGWIPMWVDPLAVMLGLEQYSFGGGRYNQTAISLPASFTVANSLVEAPVSAAKLVTGNATNADITNLTRLPLFGNYYGVAAALNAMKD